MENNHLERFDEIAKSLCNLHREKDASYGNAFGKTCKELGVGGKFYAIGCLRAKVERLAETAVNEGLNTFGESMEDSLKDLASYAIMTIVELENQKKEIEDGVNNIINESFLIPGETYKCKISYETDLGYESFTAGESYLAISKTGLRNNCGSSFISREVFEKHFEH